MQSIQSIGSNIPKISSLSVPNSGSYVAMNHAEPSPSTNFGPPECNCSVSPANSNASSTEDETKKVKQHDKWSQQEQKYPISLGGDRFNRLESKDARKVWEEIARELNKRFQTRRKTEKCKAKIGYLIDKNKAGKHWNVKQSGGHRRQSIFYEEIDAALGCRSRLC